MFVSAEANLYASALIHTDNSLLVETHLKCSVQKKGAKIVTIISPFHLKPTFELN